MCVRGFVHDGVPNFMVSLERGGVKDQLKSASMGFIFANDVS